MIQLKVYSTEVDASGNPLMFWLDLYETEPIKLTLSIEDITNAEATSVFSKAFKVPGTRKNAEFFKNSFDVDGVMYDVTVKKRAEVLVDGSEFRVGHIRLQKIFLNTELDRYDYELLFLGETRDFSSKIGDKGLCQLDLPELVGDASNNNITVAAVQSSWQAFPQNASLTAGLHNGNIIYPLIDHGNTYDDQGDVNETRISFNTPSQPTEPHITLSTGINPLTISRMKPMIRAKRIIDQIFADAGYTYTSTFFTSDLFHQIYISAFGNEATIGYESGGNSTNSINTAYGENLTGIQSITQGTPSVSNVLTFPQNQVDVGNNLTNQTYTVPTAGGSYQIRGEAYYEGYFENSDYTQTPIDARLHLWNITRNASVFSSPFNESATLQFNTTIAITPGIFEQGDQIALAVIPQSGVDYDLVTNVIFEVLSAPGQYSPAQGLECTYKQVDFIKDILTAFRLVLSPDRVKPNNFIIEPWQTYINSGELYDWSKKLVQNKDVIIEPVFFSQSETIKYTNPPGGDYINEYHVSAFDENYGYLEFNSGNDLLKGDREVKLIGIAPTPIAQMEGAVTGDNVALPQLHTHSPNDNGLQHLPLKVKTRMLFYNGLQPFTHPNNPGGPNNQWYLSGPVALTTYPLVSPYQTWPIQAESLNLNWFNDIQYWGTIAGYNENGSTLYGDYWSRYIASLYNKFSRRVTATFILNNIDLNTFSFDDTIFINGTYYRPEKIIDIQVGADTEVQVVLITANDFVPSVILNEDLTNFSGVGSNVGCANGDGIITITTDGTPGYTWTLSNGSTGSALSGTAAGAAPYSFPINNVAPGTYTVDVIDSLGRTGSVSVTVPVSTNTNPTATHTSTNPTDCTKPCNGAILVTPAGGSGTYPTIVWTSGPSNPGNNFNPTNLCPGTYNYTVIDSNGCESVTAAVVLTCTTVQNIWNYAQDFNCNTLGNVFLKVDTGASNPSLTDVVQLTAIGGTNINGCYRPISVTTGVPTHTVSLLYFDCNTCQGIVPGANYFKVVNCIDPSSQIVVKEDPANPPLVNQVFNLNGIGGCWKVQDTGDANDWSGYTMTTEYVDCTACAGPATQQMYSAEAENQGLFNSSCFPNTFTVPIYSPLTNDAALLNIGDTLYSDPGFNNPWFGSNVKAKFYSLANSNGSGVTIASPRIDGNGTIIQLNVC